MILLPVIMHGGALVRPEMHIVRGMEHGMNR